ncbi:MAG: multidrug efflux SMR transporter [Caulobacterales bacterium]|nr:multidrug efflux SMR transporter [Caulobacterales bacterium]
MAWVYLLIAGLLEIVWASALKQSAGLTRPLPTAVTLAGLVGSFALLSLAMRTLPLGVAYAAWTGVGAVGTIVVGAAVLGEPLSLLRLASLSAIILGLAGLRLSSPG